MLALKTASLRNYMGTGQERRRRNMVVISPSLNQTLESHMGPKKYVATVAYFVGETRHDETGQKRYSTAKQVSHLPK